MTSMTKQAKQKAFYAFLDQPIFFRHRLALVVCVGFLALSYMAPLWKIHLEAPQYPAGLDLTIFTHKLEGGHDGADIQEINTLNHYIGMDPIDKRALKDLDWLPFAFGILGLLALRVAAIGNIRSLIDVTILSVYVLGFGLLRFYVTLYRLGHNLDPRAPFKVAPFTPVMLGKKQIANFTTEAYPQLGTYFLSVFAAGICAILIWHLIAGRNRALQAHDVSL